MLGNLLKSRKTKAIEGLSRYPAFDCLDRLEKDTAYELMQADGIVETLISSRDKFRSGFGNMLMKRLLAVEEEYSAGHIAALVPLSHMPHEHAIEDYLSDRNPEWADRKLAVFLSVSRDLLGLSGPTAIALATSFRSFDPKTDRAAGPEGLDDVHLQSALKNMQDLLVAGRVLDGMGISERRKDMTPKQIEAARSARGAYDLQLYCREACQPADLRLLGRQMNGNAVDPFLKINIDTMVAVRSGGMFQGREPSRYTENRLATYVLTNSWTELAQTALPKNEFDQICENIEQLYNEREAMKEDKTFKFTDEVHPVFAAKTFAVGCEFFCDGIFNEKMEPQFPVDHFGNMPEELRERLKAWQAEFEELGGNIDKIPFNARGLELAQEIQDAMPDWTVRYYKVTLEEAKDMHKEMVHADEPGF